MIEWKKPDKNNLPQLHKEVLLLQGKLVLTGCLTKLEANNKLMWYANIDGTGAFSEFHNVDY